MSAGKDDILKAVDRLATDLERLSHKIHDNPELGYQEVKAAGWLTEFLAAQGFKVERGVAGVETAFRATIETGGGPTIAIMCEYDALPGIGHACGHNVIATAGAGAGAALAAVRAQLPKVRTRVIATAAQLGGRGRGPLGSGRLVEGRRSAGGRDQAPLWGTARGGACRAQGARRRRRAPGRRTPPSTRCGSR